MVSAPGDLSTDSCPRRGASRASPSDWAVSHRTARASLTRTLRRGR